MKATKNPKTILVKSGRGGLVAAFSDTPANHRTADAMVIWLRKRSSGTMAFAEVVDQPRHLFPAN